MRLDARQDSVPAIAHDDASSCAKAVVEERLRLAGEADRAVRRPGSGPIVGNSRGPKKKLERSTSCCSLTPTWIHLLGNEDAAIGQLWRYGA